MPGLVASLTTVVALTCCALARELLHDRSPDRLRDPDSYLSSWGYLSSAPLGGPGLVADGPRGEMLVRFGLGLIPVVLVVFLATWLSARSVSPGSSALPVLLGGWLGTILGTGLGALTSFQVFVVQADFDRVAPFGVPGLRLDNFQTGLYWGVVAGLLVGLVALLTWVVVRPRVVPAEPSYDTPPRVPDDFADSGGQQPR